MKNSVFGTKQAEKNFVVFAAIPLEAASLLRKSLYGMLQRIKSLTARTAATSYELLAASKSQTQTQTTKDPPQRACSPPRGACSTKEICLHFGKCWKNIVSRRYAATFSLNCFGISRKSVAAEVAARVSVAPPKIQVTGNGQQAIGTEDCHPLLRCYEKTSH